MTANEHVTSFSEGVGKPLLLTEEDIGMVKYEKTEKTFLMIDLETVGLRGNIPILSMGACAYIKGAGIFQTFYSVFDLQEQLDNGRRIDTEALHWWMGQAKEAREGLFLPPGVGNSVEGTVHSFNNWFNGAIAKHPMVDPKHVYVSAMGNDFDVAMIDGLFEGKTPWHYRNKICFRALINLFPQDIVWDDNPCKHNAIEDAKSQTRALMRLIDRFPQISSIKPDWSAVRAST